MLRATVFGNRGMAGRFTRIVRGKQSRLNVLRRQTSANVVRLARAKTRSRRVARNYKVISEGQVRFRIEARAADVGFDPRVEEFNTRPHVIVPRAGSVLAFPGQNGETVFTQRVHHPGTRGSYALTDAIREERPQFEQSVRRIMAE